MIEQLDAVARGLHRMSRGVFANAFDNSTDLADFRKTVGASRAFQFVKTAFEIRRLTRGDLLADVFDFFRDRGEIFLAQRFKNVFETHAALTSTFSRAV